MTDPGATSGLGPGRRFGPYEIGRELGRGGMGAVYHVRHAETEAEYALKVILPELISSLSEDDLERFRREAELIARIDGHPAIVRVHQVGSLEGTVFTLMELVDGRPLDEVAHGQPLRAEQAARITAAIARGLHHAHRHGVLHRDLKPGNVLIDRDGNPRVLDFGLALDTASHRLTATGEVVGTPAYMAPEQVQEGKPGAELTAATDVYGLGAVLYFMLTGAHPFEGEDAVSVMTMVVTDIPDPPSRVARVPADLEAICLAAMAKRPARRYATAARLADDLDRFLRGEPVLARRPGVLARLGRRLLPARGRRRTAVLGSAGVLLAAAAILAATWALGGLGVKRAEQVRTEQERARALDEAFGLAREGDLDALARAAALARELAGTEADDELLAERREVIETLVALRAGDEVRLRTLSLGAPPWSLHRDAIVRVLASAGRTRDLAVLLERAPDLLRDPQLASALASDLGEGRIEASDRLVDAVTDALETAEAGAEPAARAELQALAARVIARRLDVALAEDDAAALDARGHELVALLRRTGAPLRIEGEAWERLIDRALATEQTEGDELDPLLFIAARAIDEADSRWEPLHVKLQALVFAASGTEGESSWPAALDAGMLMLRLGTWPTWIEGLADYAPGRAFVAARAEEALGRDPIDPAEALPLVAIEWQRAREATRRRGLSEADAKADALAAVWPRLLPLLEREASARDLPGWVLGWIAASLAGARLHEDGPGAPPAVRALAAKARAALDATDLGAAIGEMHRAASERNRALPPRRRHVVVPLQHAQWLFTHYDVPSAKRAAPLALEAIEITRTAIRGRSFLELHGNPVNELGFLGYWIGETLTYEAPAVGDAPCPHDETIEEICRGLAGLRGSVALDAEVQLLHQLRHGRWDRAMRHLAEVRPGDEPQEFPWPTYVRAAQLLLDAGRPEGAREALDRSLPGDPSVCDPSWIELRATLWERIGEPERAARDRETVAARRRAEAPR